jgi:acetyl-CoA carboxylase carboxyl transferase subunit alpha
MKGFGLVDDVVPEPYGGAHWNYEETSQTLKSYLIPLIKELQSIDPAERIRQRIEKYSKMGFWEETPV